MDPFYRGRKFSSLEEIQAVMHQYRKEKKVEFVIRNCSILKLNPPKDLKLQGRTNQALVYRNLKLCCARGGRRFYSRGKGSRKRTSFKIGCEAFIYLDLTECGQYLEVDRLCLDHNHKLELRPPTRVEKRAEIRRRNLMKRMKISYEEAVVLERLKVSAKSGLVGPVEIEESVFDENSSESFDNFRDKEADVASSSDLKQAVSSTIEGEQSDMKVRDQDETSKLSIDLNNYSDNSEEDYDIPLKQMISSAKNTSKKASVSEAPAKDNKEPCISDDEDYRRPLIIPVAKVQKKDDDCYVSDSNSVEEENDLVDTDVPPSLQNIFTRKGDDGMTSTFSGKRLYKDDIVFKALGTIEELSSSIGHAKEFLPLNCTDISGQLVEIQCILQDMVIHVGTPQRSCSEFQRVNSQFPDTHVKRLENIIQIHEGRLPKENPIILPSGGLGSTALHVARGICRRAERKVLCLVREGDVHRNVVCYLNRLGDYLFVAARIASFFTGIKECFYSKPNFIVQPNLPVNIVKPTIPVFASANQGYLVLYPPHPL